MSFPVFRGSSLFLPRAAEENPGAISSPNGEVDDRKNPVSGSVSHPLMKKLPLLLALAASATLASAAEKQLFNGKDLTGWKGQP